MERQILGCKYRDDLASDLKVKSKMFELFWIEMSFIFVLHVVIACFGNIFLHVVEIKLNHRFFFCFWSNERQKVMVKTVYKNARAGEG